MKMDKETLLMEIEAVAWDPHTSDIEKTHAIQGLLYQWEQMCDHRTERAFGDDDAHVNSPNARRI